MSSVCTARPGVTRARSCMSDTFCLSSASCGSALRLIGTFSANWGRFCAVTMTRWMPSPSGASGPGLAAPEAAGSGAAAAGCGGAASAACAAGAVTDRLTAATTIDVRGACAFDFMKTLLLADGGLCRSALASRRPGPPGRVTPRLRGRERLDELHSANKYRNW